MTEGLWWRQRNSGDNRNPSGDRNSGEDHPEDIAKEGQL